jgi:hypothetical protein
VAVGRLPPRAAVAQIALSSGALCLALSNVACCRSAWNEVSFRHLMCFMFREMSVLLKPNFNALQFCAAVLQLLLLAFRKFVQ